MRKEIFGDISKNEDEYLDMDYYNAVVLGINSDFLDKHKYGKDLESKKLLNKIRKLENEIKKYNEEISSEEFQAKKHISSKSYDENKQKDFEKKRERILNENKTERINLKYLISIYESEISLLKIEKNKGAILKKYKRVRVLRDER